MSNLKKVNEEIAKSVTSGFQKIEDGVVGGYKKIESGAVKGYKKVEDWFVAQCLTRGNETVEEAKMRLAAEQEAREQATRKEHEKHVVTHDDRR